MVRATRLHTIEHMATDMTQTATPTSCESDSCCGTAIMLAAGRPVSWLIATASGSLAHIA
jgi:hypothetical protein